MEIQTLAAWTRDPWLNAAHGHLEGLEEVAPLQAKPAADMSGPRPVAAERVELRAGDVLTVSASSADPIELVVGSATRRISAAMDAIQETTIRIRRFMRIR